LTRAEPSSEAQGSEAIRSSFGLLDRAAGASGGVSQGPGQRPARNSPSGADSFTGGGKLLIDCSYSMRHNPPGASPRHEARVMKRTYPSAWRCHLVRVMPDA